MKKLMSKLFSIILSFLVLLNSVQFSVFAESTWDIDTGSWSVVVDAVEAPAVEQDSGSMITDGWQENWQTGHVMDSILSTGVDLQNTGLNADSESDEWQSWQVSEIPQGLAPSREQTPVPENITRASTITPELIISEVFFDWTSEWIEIYNLSSTEFSWDIVISGASASIKNISNLVIAWLETKIFTDTSVDSILNTSNVFQTNMWFSISDTSDMDIDLIYSWVVLDSVNLSAVTVSSLSNKISFHRFVDTLNIVESDLIHTSNTTTGYIANPWVVYTEIIPVTDPELIITEVYFDGDEERFEITNVHNTQDFSGNISLAWDLNLNINTQILLWESMVFANAIYSMFQTWDNIQIISVLSGWIDEINFDTGAINLDLVRSGQTLDTFYAHETRVKHYDGRETSFEKIWQVSMSPASRTTTVVWLASDRYYNTNWWIAANPTTYFTTWENLIDVTQAREENITPNLTWLDTLCEELDNSYLQVSEYFNWNERYPMYIEVEILDDWITDYFVWIYFSGTAITWDNPYFDFYNYYDREEDIFLIDFDLNKKILFSNQDFRHDEMQDALFNTEFDIQTWILEVYWFDGDDFSLLDIISISDVQFTKSTYYDSQDFQCVKSFSDIDNFSPWFDKKYIKYFETIHIECPSCNCWWATTKYIEKFNTDDNLQWTIKISAMKHFGSLQILKLQNKTDVDIDLRDYKLESLDWSTQTIKWNTLFANKTMSFVWNYDFPTKKDYCFNLIKVDNVSNNTNSSDIEVIDRYCRNSMSKASSLDEQRILNQLSFWMEGSDVDDESLIEPEPTDPITVVNPMQTNTIKIIELDYNPAWSDRGNESITLLLMSGSQIDLSNYILQYTKDGKSTNKKISWILTQWSQQIFKWDFTLPNSTKDKLPVTVNLIKQNQYNNQNYIVDTYIYNPNKITEIPDWNYEVVSVIDWDTIKISYANQNFNIRFAGIDAPESSTLRCGKVECFWPEAKTYLKSLLENQTIRFESSLDSSSSTQDSFDRFVWYIYLSWENINQNLIKNWYAREYSYKNKDYKYSAEFKSAQNYAQANSLWLRWDVWNNWDNINGCNGQRLCPVEETASSVDLISRYLFNIEDIIYNPDWVDTDNEIIKISMPKWSDINQTSVDLADGFYLMINDTRKSLKNYGTISPWDTKTLQWTFSFPNTKKTTVSLFNGETAFDSYIYDPVIDKLIQDELDAELDSQIDTGSILTWDLQNTDISQLWYSISIVSILPNPLWKDTIWEEVWLLYSINNSGEKLKINLASGYYLKIWDKKTYFNNKKIYINGETKNNNLELTSNQEALLIWKFAMPNKASCVEIGYENLIFDQFCYSDPEEWQKFIKSNWVLESINVIDFSILNKAKLENIWNQVCLTFGSQNFYCKNMPYSKLSVKKINQNKLYKEFFDSFENYLKDQRKIMYYDTDIKNYFNLLNEIEKAISEWKSEFILDDIKYKTSEFQSMYEFRHPKTTTVFIQQNLSEFIPKQIRNKYSSLLDEYNEYLMRIN